MKIYTCGLMYTVDPRLPLGVVRILDDDGSGLEFDTESRTIRILAPAPSFPFALPSGQPSVEQAI